MIYALATALAAQAAGPAMLLQPLENVFISACLDGSVKLNASEARPVGFETLPGALRKPLGSPSRAQVWKLSSPGDSYLYVLEYAGSRGSPHVCGVASNSMLLAAARDAVAQRLGASAEGDSQSSTEWLMPKEGYTALATRVRGYTALQVNQHRGEPQADAAKP